MARLRQVSEAARWASSAVAPSPRSALRLLLCRLVRREVLGEEFDLDQVVAVDLFHADANHLLARRRNVLPNVIGTNRQLAVTAIDDDGVAAVMYLPGATSELGAVPLSEVIKIAHARGVPVIVDAASQIPPIENLWHFSGHGGPAPWARAQKAIGVRPDAPDDVVGLGADLAIFSGGKGLCGPASTGLILGRRDLIDAIARQGNPAAISFPRFCSHANKLEFSFSGLKTAVLREVNRLKTMKQWNNLPICLLFSTLLPLRPQSIIKIIPKKHSSQIPLGL